MSSNTSPTRFSEPEDSYLSEANFRADINYKMRVPNKISMNDYDGEIPNGLNSQWSNNFSNNYSNMNMQVPERILVAGGDQHIGTRAPPREIILDNEILPTAEPENIRVHTPPRVITLDKYQFPMVDDKDENIVPTDVVPVVKPRAKFNLDKETRLIHRDREPPIGSSTEGVNALEEVLHLRRQMAKMNRRVMALEMEVLNRQQKEKFIYGIGIAYFILKTILWLNRS